MTDAQRRTGQPDPETVRASIDALEVTIEGVASELRSLRQAATVLLGITSIVLSVAVTDPPVIAEFESPEVGWALLFVAGFAAMVSLLSSLSILFEAEGVPVDLAPLVELDRSPDSFRLRRAEHLATVLRSLIDAVARTQGRLRVAAIAGVLGAGAFSLGMTARDVAIL